MVPALGSAEKNHITEYKDVRAYIRFRKPADIRLIGLMPVVRSKMFDMVSDGADFKLYIPTKNHFIVGRNAIEELSPNKLENLRPQHFLDALLVRPVDPKTNKVMLENFTDEDNAYYIIHEIHEQPDGNAATPAHHLVQPPRPAHGPPDDLRRHRQHAHRRPLFPVAPLR